MCDKSHGDIAQIVADSGAVGADLLIAEQVTELVTANHILYAQGVVDAFGHVSVRHATRGDCFLMARNMAPGLVTEQDIIAFDLDCRPMNADGRSVYLERFIHGEIYKARPEVMAVVHSHSPSVVPFGVIKQSPFRAVCHMAAFVGVQPPIFDIRDVAGDGTDLLITDQALGAALAGTLGTNAVVLMRGHGSTAVGDSLRHAVFRAVYTEINARTQAQASQLGEIIFLSEAETRAAALSTEGQSDRAWNLWKRTAQSVHLSLLQQALLTEQ
ncbi:class II aldolase/adducin family protein [Pusillimonas sp. CC-YST705]|uniref:Class II aldolase/adducin family protein n=1 Tax=Mesopusillimonas faecipullorum TaxID=2755040 RepID=A0ABS8C981_9BURK|nr:class II aldolase/adducin family protein [Mesopusillimonas faecipullorum]MCB5362587.1 class II aldolase/adducin family protein [Mesopusillimonas faecipullorum]